MTSVNDYDWLEQLLQVLLVKINGSNTDLSDKVGVEAGNDKRETKKTNVEGSG